MKKRKLTPRPKLRKNLARAIRKQRRPMAFSALEVGDDQMIEMLLGEKPDLGHERDLNGITLLRAAAFQGRNDLVEMLLATASPLDPFEAAALGRADRLAEILDAGEAGPDDESPEGFSLLHLACFFGHESTAALLLDRGAAIEHLASHPMGVRPAHAAAAGMHLDVVKLLLDRHANVNATQGGGWTLLHHAAHHGNPEFASYLLERGADPRARNDKGQTPADLASALGREDLSSILTP